MKLKRNINKMLTVAALSGAALGMSAVPAGAVITIHATETVGGNVEFNGSGSLNPAALGAPRAAGYLGVGVSPSAGFVYFRDDLPETLYTPGGSFPAIGSGSVTYASSSSGSSFALAGSLLFLPTGYSGEVISFGMMFDGTDFATMGVTPGIYPWEFGTPGQATDSVVLKIGKSVPDTGTTALLGLLAFGGLGFLRRFMK